MEDESEVNVAETAKIDSVPTLERDRAIHARKNKSGSYTVPQTDASRKSCTAPPRHPLSTDTKMTGPKGEKKNA